MRMLPVDTAVTVFVNATALIDDTDFKTREESVVFNQAGLDLVWNFETPAGVITQTAVTPTDTAGVYDWTNVGNGMYKIAIPASGGGTINNDAEGYGFFSGYATGILPWTGPTYPFVPAHVVNGLISGSDALQVDAIQVGGTTQTAGDAVGELAKVPKSDGTASWNATALAAINAEADTAISDAALATAANLATVAGYLDTEIAAILADTNELQINQGNWLTATGFAVAGDQMDLVAAPNATAVTAVQNGLATAANLATVDTVVDAIKLVTDALPDSGALTSLSTAAALATVDTVVDAIKVVTDALGSAAAANLALSAAGIIGGTAQTGTLSTTVMTTDLTGYGNDVIIGRVVIWTGGDAKGQASDITDYASASGTVTYTAITTAPANGDTFVIV